MKIENKIPMLLALVGLISVATAVNVNGSRHKPMLHRRRRDLIGYNRQQNNVLGHMRMTGVDIDQDFAAQILKFIQKNGKKSASKTAKKILKGRSNHQAGRSSRFNRFRRHHR